MGFFARVKSWFVTTEADVLKFAMDVWNEVPIAAKRIASAASWLDSKAIPALQVQMDLVQPYLATIGAVTGHPEIAVALTAAHTAVDRAVAFKDSVKTGNITADDVVQGFSQVKTAQAAVNNVFAVASHVVAVTPYDNPPKVEEKE